MAASTEPGTGTQYPIAIEPVRASARSHHPRSIGRVQLFRDAHAPRHTIDEKGAPKRGFEPGSAA